MRLAQCHDLERVTALVDARKSGPLRPDEAVIVLSALIDCTARLRSACEGTPALIPARARLLDWQTELTRWRDRMLTKAIRRGPARRPDRPRQGWNQPAPRG